MLITLVEDDVLKARQITAYLNETLDQVTVKTYGSFQSGLRSIDNEIPEVLLLDMTLPTFDRSPAQREGRIRPLGGYELMRKLRLRSIQVKVVIVSQLESFGEGDNKTSFHQIAEKCKEEFPSIYLGAVHYRQGSSTWKSSLSAILNSYVESRR